MTLRLVFAHGWALDRTLWDAVMENLGELAQGAIMLDAGYYGRPATLEQSALGGRLLGVGQSLGALELLARAPAPLSGLVAIDGFARFAQAPDFAAGQDVRKLQLMARRLDADPRPLVADFLGRALRGVTPPGEPSRPALARGLDRLAALDGRAALGALPLWRLHAEDDPIAPLALCDASFASADQRARIVRPGSDHLSPLSTPKACAALIQTAVRTLTS